VFHNKVLGTFASAASYPEANSARLSYRPPEVFMPIAKVLSRASLVFVALILAATAQAQNDGKGMNSRPPKAFDSAKKADRQEKRKEQRDFQRQQRGSGPPKQSRPN